MGVIRDWNLVLWKTTLCGVGYCPIPTMESSFRNGHCPLGFDHHDRNLYLEVRDSILIRSPSSFSLTTIVTHCFISVLDITITPQDVASQKELAGLDIRKSPSYPSMIGNPVCLTDNPGHAAETSSGRRSTDEQQTKKSNASQVTPADCHTVDWIQRMSDILAVVEDLE